MLHIFSELQIWAMIARLENAMDGLNLIADTLESEDFDRAIDPLFGDILDVCNALEERVIPPDAVRMLGDTHDG